MYTIHFGGTFGGCSACAEAPKPQNIPEYRMFPNLATIHILPYLDAICSSCVGMEGVYLSFRGVSLWCVSFRANEFAEGSCEIARDFGLFWGRNTRITIVFVIYFQCIIDVSLSYCRFMYCASIINVTGMYCQCIIDVLLPYCRFMYCASIINVLECVS